MPKIIPGALWRDPEKIDQWISELPTGIPTVVYCVKGGSVSRSVADLLRKAGLVALFLEGGSRHGLTTVRPSRKPSQDKICKRP
jgi:hypothetical protein